MLLMVGAETDAINSIHAFTQRNERRGLRLVARTSVGLRLGQGRRGYSWDADRTVQRRGPGRDRGLAASRVGLGFKGRGRLLLGLGHGRRVGVGSVAGKAEARGRCSTWVRSSGCLGGRREGEEREKLEERGGRGRRDGSGCILRTGRGRANDQRMSKQSKKMNFLWGLLVSGEKGEGVYMQENRQGNTVPLACLVGRTFLFFLLNFRISFYDNRIYIYTLKVIINTKIIVYK
jgi:hypothetical protein